MSEIEIPPAGRSTMSTTPTYTVKRERVTWVRWDRERLRQVSSTPVQFCVYEDGEWVKTCDTKAEADGWITQQGGAR